MSYILFDDNWQDLLPLTFTRPVCEVRIGILTVREKWEHELKTTCSTLTQPHLLRKFPTEVAERNVYVNGSVCPDSQLIAAINELDEDQCLVQEGRLLAVKSRKEHLLSDLTYTGGVEYPHPVLSIERPWHIFLKNGEALQADFERLTRSRTSEPLSDTNLVIGNGSVFLEPGAKAEACVFNTTEGPVYLGRDSEVMEGSVIRGPFALCEHSTVKLGAKIYGPTTVGPHSKVGGEVNNSVIFGYSNKGHDGFLGNSVLGEWCNLGADTNNSNLKNNYDEVRVWNYREERFVKTGLQFCGLIMGDHSKSGINTMFNTGTVVGVSSNVFGSGFPRTFIPSFQWGGAAGFTEYMPDKAFATAERVMARRNVAFDEIEKNILSAVFELTKRYRN